MADNKEEKNEELSNEFIPSADPQAPNPPIEATPVLSSDENNAAVINTTPSPIQEAENMEVHHHSHAHGRRNWKSYAWEFVMLFLAVFCGFLAEYQLEHVIEHQREKQYVRSLVEDLRSDQEAISTHITTLQGSSLMLDTLIQILNDAPNIANRTGDLYYFARIAPRLHPLSSNIRTFEQLKNSGNLRLIRNLGTSNRIMAYYEKIHVIRMLEHIDDNENSDYKRAAAKIFDSSIFLKMEGLGDEIKRDTVNPKLRNSNSDLLQELSIFALYQRGTRKGIIGRCEDLRGAGQDLLKYLQAEYHID